MEEAASQSAELSALDMALIPSFFISYSVLALSQLNLLFSERFVFFAGLAVGSYALAIGLGAIDFSGFCEGTQSVVICGSEARGLRAFGVVWTWVSAAVLGMYLVSRGLTKWRERRGE
ncbi:MAG: hypothetical protein AAF401_02880 [Pseudomonadota bacterium]